MDESKRRIPITKEQEVSLIVHPFNVTFVPLPPKEKHSQEALFRLRDTLSLLRKLRGKLDGELARELEENIHEINRLVKRIHKK